MTAPLTENQVLRILHLYEETVLTTTEIARALGVHQTTVSRILKREGKK